MPSLDHRQKESRRNHNEQQGGVVVVPLWMAVESLVLVLRQCATSCACLPPNYFLTRASSGRCVRLAWKNQQQTQPFRLASPALLPTLIPLPPLFFWTITKCEHDAYYMLDFTPTMSEKEISLIFTRQQ
jgi:hypothetical protein